MDNFLRMSSPPTPKKSFVKEWLVLPKLIFFFLGIIHFCLVDVLTKYVISNFNILEERMADYRGTYAFASFIGSLSFAVISDKFKIHRFVLIGCALGYLISSLSLVFPFSGDEERKFSFFLALSLLQKIFLTGTLPIVNAMIMSSLPENSKSFFCRQSIFLIVAHIFNSLFLNRISNTVKFHLILLAFSTVAFIFVVFLFDDAKKESASEIETPDFIAQKVLLFRSRARLSSSKKNPNSIWTFLPDIKFIVMIIGVLIAGFNSSYLQKSCDFVFADLFGENWRRIVAKSIFFIIVYDISTIFFYKDLYQFMGAYWIWNIGHFILIVRTSLFTLMPADGKFGWIFILSETFKGVGQGMLSTSMAHAASDLSTDKFAATAQSIFSSAFIGVSTILAQLVLKKQPPESPLFVENIKLTYTVSIIIGAIIIVAIGITEIVSSKNSTKSRV